MIYLKFHLGILLGIFLVVSLLVPDVYGTYSSRDLDKVSLEVLDTQVLYMDDTPGYYLDNADLIKVTVKVTNNKLGNFLVQDKMFRILVMETDRLKSTPEKEVQEQVDNYETIYDINLEVNYDNFPTRELYEECDFINKTVRPGESLIFTVCYEVLQSWSGMPVNLDGPRKYFLVMSETSQTTSCNKICYKILLSNQLVSNEIQIPKWIQNIFYWHLKGSISDSEFQRSINYLQEQNILPKVIPESIKNPDPNTLEAKNQIFKEYQKKLAAVLASNLYVSAMTFYETQYFDDFTGVTCKQQNNIVTFSGDYTNDDVFYNVVFFKLLLFEGNKVVETGLSKIVDVVPGNFRHFEVSAPYQEEFNYCLGIIDSKFGK